MQGVTPVGLALHDQQTLETSVCCIQSARGGRGIVADGKLTYLTVAPSLFFSLSFCLLRISCRLLMINVRATGRDRIAFRPP